MLNIIILLDILVSWLIGIVSVIFLLSPILLIVWVIIVEKTSVLNGDLYKSRIRKMIKVTVVFSIIVSTLSTVFYLNSESFDREIRKKQVMYGTEEVYREMKVVGRSGEIIYETGGNFEVERKDDLLVWVNEDGELNEVHIGNSSTVIVEEVEN